MIGKLVLLVALANAACLRSTEYRCTSDSQCDPAGHCEPSGFCSVADPSCASGSRYSDTAGANANQCVGSGPDDHDAGLDPDGGGSCPMGYVAVPMGQAGHRYLLRTSSNAWTSQRDACSSGATYLAIPDDAAELAAITSLASQRVWIGISDRATENTFLTVKDTAALYLPWEPGAPGGDDRDDCVEAIAGDPARINDERCDRDKPAVCECEP